MEALISQAPGQGPDSEPSVEVLLWARRKAFARPGEEAWASLQSGCPPVTVTSLSAQAGSPLSSLEEAGC